MTRARAPAKRRGEADPYQWRTRCPPAKSKAGRLLRELAKGVGQLVEDYRLIRANDQILCALSGGKDSYAMLEVLLHLQARAPVDFALGAIVVDPGFPNFQAEQVVTFAAERGVETFLVPSDILATIEQLRWKESPCALCARLRRGVLYRVTPTLGYDTLALGHHADDAIETALLNLFFNGQLRAMAPVHRPSDSAAPRVIRPLVTTFESVVAEYAQARNFILVDSACPVCDAPETERQAIKHWLIELSAEHPRIRQSLLAALGNVSPDGLMDRRLRKDQPS